jgi:hypothetical protein
MQEIDTVAVYKGLCEQYEKIKRWRCRSIEPDFEKAWEEIKDDFSKKIFNEPR